MILRKIKDSKKVCTHPGHNVPSHVVLEPGTYEHQCPGCGEKVVFEVPGIINYSHTCIRPEDKC